MMTYLRRKCALFFALALEFLEVREANNGEFSQLLMVGSLMHTAESASFCRYIEMTVGMDIDEIFIKALSRRQERPSLERDDET